MLEGSVSECNFGKAFGGARRRPSTIAFVGMLALTMAGCGSGSEESNTSTPSAPQVVNTQLGAKPFDKPPMVAQNSNKSSISLAPSLIQPTNSNQRAKQVQKGRQDPFAGLFVQAAPSVSTTATPQTTVTPLPSLPQLRAPQTKPVRTSSTGGGGNPGSQPNYSRTNRPPRVVPGPIAANPLPRVVPGSSEANPLPPIAPDSTSEPVLPPPQDPDLARSVAVMGVVQVGSEPLAIVKVPNEATSRYVRVGQRLSNGQVLVKRIEINDGSEPVVILEQYGIEVAKEVGEKPANSTQAAAPTGGSPDTPPPDSASSSPPDASPDTPSPGNETSSPTDASPVPPPPNFAPSSPTDASPVPPNAQRGTRVPSPQDFTPSPTDGSPVTPSPDNAPSIDD